MSNIEITHNDYGSVAYRGPRENNDEALTVDEAGTVKAGTILARDTSTDKLVVYEKNGSTDGNGVPHSVLTYDLVAEASGDHQARVLVKGTVTRERLVIHADGDDANVDHVEIDGLRARSIVVDTVDQLASLDNEPEVDS